VGSISKLLQGYSLLIQKIQRGLTDLEGLQTELGLFSNGGYVNSRLCREIQFIRMNKRGGC